MINKINNNYLDSIYPPDTPYADGGPLKKGIGNQYYDDNTIYNILPNETDNDSSITQHVYLPNVTVTAQKPKVESANDPVSGLSFLNDATLGVLNRLSPTQNIRAIKDSFDDSLSFRDKENSWLQGNNGVITNNFSKKHPILSTAVNAVTDIGIGGLAGETGRIINNLRPSNIRANMYISKPPLGYDNMGKAIKTMAKNTLTKSNFDISNPPWDKKELWDNLADTYANVVNPETARKARVDAYRMYNKFPQLYNTFTPSPTYPGSYTAASDISKLKEVYPSLNKDWINTSGGGIHATTNMIGSSGPNQYGVISTRDLWDLQPFSSIEDYSFMGNKFFKNKLISPLTQKIKNLEIGSITGAKPFTVINEIPFTFNPSNKPMLSKGFNFDSLLGANKEIPQDINQFMLNNPTLDYQSNISNYQNMHAAGGPIFDYNQNNPGNINNIGKIAQVPGTNNPLSNPSSGLFSDLGNTFKSGLSSKSITNGLSSTIKNNIGAFETLAGSAAGSLIGGGNHSGAGDAIGSIGGTASGLIGKANPVLGGVVGAASGVVGGLVNGAFGSNINQEAVNNYKQLANKENNLNFSASTNDSLLGQSNYNYLGHISKSDIGSDGWFSNKASRLANNLETQRLNANRSADLAYSNAAGNIEERTNNSLMQNYSAYGGHINRFDSGGNLSYDPNEVVDSLFNQLNIEGDGTEFYNNLANNSYAPQQTGSNPNEWSPSSAILNRISNWEGNSMRTNVPHNEELRRFRAVTPNLQYLSNNQRDALYSTYYNAPKQYQRDIVPLLRSLSPDSTMTDYMNIKNHITAGMTRKDLPGLAKRRLAEQNIFLNGYQ